MSNWIQHCKKYQAHCGCSWKEALKGAKESYQRGGSDKPETISDLFDDKKFPTDHPYWNSNKQTKPKKKSKVIAPTLMLSDPAPKGSSIFNPPVSKSKKPKKGSDEWYKKKEESSSNYLQGLINRIEKGEGNYGKSKYKKAYKVDDFTKMGKKKKSSKAPKKSEVKTNKKNTQKWKDLFKQNQSDTLSACKPNQIRVRAYCRNVKQKGSGVYFDEHIPIINSMIKSTRKLIRRLWNEEYDGKSPMGHTNLVLNLLNRWMENPLNANQHQEFEQRISAMIRGFRQHDIFDKFNTIEVVSKLKALKRYVRKILIEDSLPFQE